MLGKAIKVVSTPATDSATLDVASLAKGVYLIEITADSNAKVTKKLIIE